MITDRGYNVNQLETLTEEDNCNKVKKIIIVIGGTEIPLRHAYVVSQKMIDEGSFDQDKIGALVIDLDI